MLIFSAINVAGCAAYLTIPDEQYLVSSYQDKSKHSAGASCEIKAPVETLYDIANNEISNDALNPDSFRLLNWNVFKGSHESWQQDFRRFQADSDIVTLQEAHLHPTFESELKDSELYWDLNVAFELAEAEAGVLIASRFQPDMLCSQQAIEPLIRTPKTTLVTSYPVLGSTEKLLVANIHMINFSFGTREYQKQIDRLVNVLAQHDGPLIIAGDFNTWNQRRNRIISDMADLLKLTAVNFEIDHRLTVFGNVMDHVYYRGLETINASTHEVETSDHNPMIIEFRLLET